jgi:hypothetical protein
MGFYDVQNLGNFTVSNQQISLQQNVQDLRQYQYHQMGIQNAFPENELTITGTAAAPGRTLTLDEVLNGAKNLYFTKDYTGAFLGNGTGAFVPSLVKRYYVNYLPTSIMGNTDTKYPSDYAVIANFGFKNYEGYRYYTDEFDQNATAENATESHLWGIPKNFGVAPPFRVGRGTEILLMWNNPYKPNQPLEARFLLKNAYDWLSINGLQGPLSQAYNPNLAPYESDPAPDTTLAGAPTNGVLFTPEPYGLSTQWFY